MSEALVLVINTGSSSIKMALIEMATERLLAEAMAERLGEDAAVLHCTIDAKNKSVSIIAATHASAMSMMLELLFAQVDKGRITAVGHRVVHGGERFVTPTIINASVIIEIEHLSPLAPLHNPANVQGIKEAMAQLPDIEHIAVFDTAFHYAMPLYASLYAVPYAWYQQQGVRRYGFHGSSHHYVGQQAAMILGRDFNDCKLLTAHLGNGCSIAAIADGKSIDTTMGMTPLDGLMMGTRSGDIDPGLFDYIARERGLSLQQITDVLNKKSGLLGISGQSNDMRSLLAAAESGDQQAELAIDMFCYRLAKSLASLAVPLGRIDAIVFTGGIGEHAARVRSQTIALLSIFGLSLDEERNQHDGVLSAAHISQKDAITPVLVIATNEELMIARYVHKLMKQQDETI